MKKTLVASTLALGAFLLVPRAAEAATDRPPHWSAAGLIGYGFEDGADFGLGLRLGYTLKQNIYLGGLFQYHFGFTDHAGIALANADHHVNIMYFGFEGGYDIHVDSVVIRPYMGIGPGFVHESFEGCAVGFCPKSSDTDSDFAFWFGGAVLYQIDGKWFVGGDFRVPIVNGDAYASLFFTGGLNF